MYEDLLFGYYSLPFKISVKALSVTLILLFFLFILNISTRFFGVKKSVGRKYCQLKALKVLLIICFSHY